MHVALNPPDGVAPVDVIRSTLSGSTRAEPDRVPLTDSASRAWRLGAEREREYHPVPTDTAATPRRSAAGCTGLQPVSTKFVSTKIGARVRT